MFPARSRAAPFLFVRSDPAAPSHPDVRHIEQRGHEAVGAVEPAPANGTEIQVGICEGATGAAAPLVTLALVQAAWGSLKGYGLPLAALVVEEVLGSELANGEKPGSADELTLSPRNPRAHRERREVVAGQEPFAGEIAVRVEVAFFPGDTHLEQEVQLTPGLVLAVPGPALLVHRAGPVLFGPGRIALPFGRSIELTPAIERFTEGPWRFFDQLPNPPIAEPAAGSEHAFVGGEKLTHAALDLASRRLVELDLGRGLLAKR